MNCVTVLLLPLLGSYSVTPLLGSYMCSLSQATPNVFVRLGGAVAVVLEAIFWLNLEDLGRGIMKVKCFVQ